MSRSIGIDLGERRTGVSISDDNGRVAVGLTTLTKERKQSDLIRRLIRLAKQNNVESFAVGLPLNLDGSEGASALKAKAFAEALASRSGLPVALIDERLTTVSATRALSEMKLKRTRTREVIDQSSAVLILQSHLDREGSR